MKFTLRRGLKDKIGDSIAFFGTKNAPKIGMKIGTRSLFERIYVWTPNHSNFCIRISSKKEESLVPIFVPKLVPKLIPKKYH